MSDPPHSEFDRLRHALERLERRVERIEQTLEDGAAASVKPHQAPQQRTQDQPELLAVGDGGPAPSQPPPLPVDWLEQSRARRSEATVALPGGAVVGPPPPLPIPLAEVAPTRDSGAAARPTVNSHVTPARSLETLIGQNWASWVGAIVLFLGIVFFLKYAWDQGWIRPSPAMRVAAAVGAGAVLCAIGEWLHWRRMRALAGALYGGGVSIIIASFFGAHAYFNPPVIGATAAFTAVALTAAASILVALHINVSVVALLGLIGAYLAPNLLAGPDDRSTFFMLYLALLALAALGLAQLRRNWVVLRWLALAGTYLWLPIWWRATGRQGAHETLALVAGVGFAAAFVLDCAITFMRLARSSLPDARGSFTEFFGIRIETGPLDVHAILAAILAVVASMAHLLTAWDRAEPAQSNIAAIAMALLVAGPGLLLGHLRPRWVALRWVALILSYVWLALWWSDVGRTRGEQILALVWALSLYAALLAENVLTLRRWGGEIVWRPAASAARPLLQSPLGGALAPPRPAPAPITIDAQIGAISLVSTAAALGAVLWSCADAPMLVGAIALVLAVVQTAAALVARSREYFVSSILQSAALVTLAVPLLLDEFAVTLAWIVLATALALAAWQLNLPKARGWAAALLLLALVRLVIFDFRDPALRSVEFHIFDQPVSRWLLVGWSIALLYHLLAWLRPGSGADRWPALRAWVDRVVPAPRVSHASGIDSGDMPRTTRDHPPDVLPYASPARDAIGAFTGHLAAADLHRSGATYAAFGTIVFVALLLVRWHGPPATLAMIGWLAGLMLLSNLGRRIGYVTQLYVLGAIVTARWLLLDNFIPLTDTWRHGGGATHAIANVPALCGALLAAVFALRARLARGLDTSEPHRAPRPPIFDRIVPIVWSAAIAFALLNFELIRYVDTIAGLGDPAIVKQVALSVLWAVVGFVAVILGFRKHIAPLRWAALALLAITLAKILVIDMAEVKAIWRILSFVAVGALLLAVSYVYHRQSEGRSAEEV